MFNIGTLRGVLELDDQFSSRLNAAASGLEGFSKSFTQAGLKLNSFGHGLLPLSAALAAVGVGAVKMSRDLNATIANASALLTDLSGPALDSAMSHMKSGVQSLAIEMGKSTKDIGEGLYSVISAFGLTGDTFGQLQASAKAGAAGLSSTEDAFRLLTAVTQVYGDTSEKAFKKVGDLSFQVVNFGLVTFPELAQAIGKVAPIAQIAGVSMEEMFAIIATASGITGDASEVTTQMVSAMNGLLAPSKATQTMFDRLGFASGQAMIAELGLAGSLREVARYSEEANVPIMELLGRKEAFVITAALANNLGDRFTEMSAHMAEAAVSGGSIVDAAFAKQTDGINKAGFAWGQLMAKVEVAMQNFGDRVSPILLQAYKDFEPMIDAVLDLGAAFGELPTQVQSATVALGGLIIAAPAVLYFLGSAATLAGLVTKAWELMAKGVGAAAKVLAGSTVVEAAAPTVLTLADKQMRRGETTTDYKARIAEMSAISQATSATTTEVGLLGRAWSMLLGPIGLVTAAIGATAIAWANFKDDWTRAFDVLIPPLGIIRGSLDGMAAGLRDNQQLISDVGSIINSLWVIGMRELNKEVAAATAWFKSWEGSLTGVWGALKDVNTVVGSLGKEALFILLPGLRNSGEALAQLKGYAEVAKIGIHNLAVNLEKQAGTQGGALLTSTMDLTKFQTGLTRSVIQYSAASKIAEGNAVALAEAEEEAARKARAAADAYRALVASLSGKTAFADAATNMKAIGEIGGVTKLTNAEQSAMLSKLTEVVAKYTAMGKVAPASLMATVVWLDAMNTKLKDSSSLVDMLNQKFDTNVGDPPPIFGVPIDPKKWMQEFPEDPWQPLIFNFRQGLKNVFLEIPDLLKSAFTNGGGILGAMKALAVSFGSLLTQYVSAALKNAFAKDKNGKLVGSGSIGGGTLMAAGGLGALAGVGAAASGQGFGAQAGQVGLAGVAMGAQAMAMGASMAGAAAMAGVTAGIGLAVIAGVAIYKNATKAEWKKLGSDIGRDFGVTLSEEVLKAMEGDSKKFGRQATGILHLDEIIRAAGGLNAGNVSKFTGSLRDLFSMLETGKLSMAQAVEVMDKNWDEFAKAGTDANGRLSQSLVEVIKLARQFGVESKAMQGYLQGQAGTAVGGLSSIMSAGSGMDAWRELAVKIQEAKDRIKELRAETERTDAETKELAKTEADLAEMLAQQARNTKGVGTSLTDLGIIAMSTMAAATASGMSFMQALQMAQPALQKLSQAYKDLGIEVEDAGMKMLLQQSDMLAANPALAAGVDGLKGTMIALSNMGMLNADTFAAMERTGLAMFTRLQGESAKFGGTTSEINQRALIPMQAWLHEAERQAKLLGIPLDANTQMLIDQSKELGIWKEEGKSGMELVTDAIIAMTEKLGDFINLLMGIPPVVTTTVQTNYEGEPPPGGGGGGGGNGENGAPNGAAASNQAAGYGYGSDRRFEAVDGGGGGGEKIVIFGVAPVVVSDPNQVSAAVDAFWSSVPAGLYNDRGGARGAISGMISQVVDESLVKKGVVS